MGANWRGTKSRTRYENIHDFKLQDIPLYTLMIMAGIQEKRPSFVL